MYEFWYDYIGPKYGDKAKLCYTDTDSFIINIKTEDFLEDISKMLRDGFIYLTITKMIRDLCKQVRNKKVPGLFKDELGSKIITEVVAL